MSDPDFTSLDDLFDMQQAAAIATKKAVKVAKHGVPNAEPKLDRRVFTNPENWKRARNVALIHEETQTVLGVFVEWTHRTEDNCRKLLRTEEPAAIHATELVAGSWWLGSDARPKPAASWHEKRFAVVHLHLDKLHVHSPAVEVVAYLSYGSIERVELASDTTFAQELGEHEQLVMLPAGANVLDVMSRDAKIALRLEIGL